MRRNIYDRLSERREREECLERERLEEEARNAEPPPPERFLTNELSFIRPENLKDKTFHVFTLTDIGPSPFSFVVGVRRWSRIRTWRRLRNNCLVS